MIVVLDIDSTLIYADFDDEAHDILSDDPKYRDRLFTVSVLGKNMNCLKREGLDEFLKKLSKQHTIVIWSAGTSEYVNAVVKKLNIPAVKVFSREYCVSVLDRDIEHPILRKPLKKLIEDPCMQQYKLSYDNIVMIDDRRDVMSEDVDKHIEVPAFRVLDSKDGAYTTIGKVVCDGYLDDVLSNINSRSGIQRPQSRYLF